MPISQDMPDKTVKTPLTIKEVGELLIKHYKLHEGMYDISIEFGFGFGGLEDDSGVKMPGAILGVRKIGLVASGKVGPATLDASLINPKKTKSKKSTD